MRFLCNLPADKRTLAVILTLLGALIIAFALTGCPIEDPTLSAREKRPQVVKETKVHPVYNKKHLPMGEFMKVVGNEIDHMETYYGYTIYKIRVEIMRNLERVCEIHTVWLYYE